MSNSEWAQIAQKIAGMWPNMKMTAALSDMWQRLLIDCQFSAVLAALEEHWRDGDKAYPDQKKVRELVRVHTKEYFAPGDAQRQARYYAMDDISKARADRDWHQRLANSEPDIAKKRYHEKCVVVAAARAARLYRVAQRGTARPASVAEVEKVMRCKIQREE